MIDNLSHLDPASQVDLLAPSLLRGLDFLFFCFSFCIKVSCFNKPFLKELY